MGLNSSKNEAHHTIRTPGPAVRRLVYKFCLFKQWPALGLTAQNAHVPCPVA